MHKPILRTAAFLGAIAVMLGAFAAHGLKERLSSEAMHIFMTGERYQFYHVLALLGTGIIWQAFPNRKVLWAAGLFVSGIVLFSGSLYLLALSGEGWLGWITPVGGTCFIAGWLVLAAGLNRG